MKLIKYKVICYDHIMDENGDDIQVENFAEVTAGYSEESLKLAEQNAYNGEYTIEEDGQPESIVGNTDDVLNAMLGVTV